jgi:very-short-patch-repair endonuclease
MSATEPRRSLRGLTALTSLHKSSPHDMALRKALTRALSQGERGRKATDGRRGNYRGGRKISTLVDRTRALRNRQTPAEVVLWEAVRDRKLCNAKFRRQHQFGKIICDFYCDEAKLVIECDGSSHDTVDRIQKDANRDRFLRAQGLTVMRFRNTRVLKDLNAVLRKITKHLTTPSHRTPAKP